MNPDLPPLGLIAGPTASGKTGLALRVAERTGATIINADASQVYRDLRILTARPSAAEEAAVPHRLFGHIDAAVAHNVAAWAEEARAAIAAVHAQGGVPLLVGGTGLYLRTLIDGIAPVPEIDPAIRAAVRALDAPALHAALLSEDPGVAARLRPSDTSRLARALEVVRSSGRSLADWQAHRVGGIGGAVRLVPLLLLPEAKALAARIDRRFEAMLAEGAVAEVEALVARGLDPALPAMRAIGVAEIAAWRAGRIYRATAVASAQAASRRYAKRQRTWFRHQSPAEWPRTEQLSDSQAKEFATRLLVDGLTR
ncbi:tRNA (adenosine(37)-N6)-dimethylallyltransferase MiaA [Sphingomonas morindae]|uniref:tRNA dimethylallyltransferase n=1 Tax=Sphingomonas morindae TaxID=1541170 RepID=A0ABY4X5F1_9SPHN|nr:tRNA (adenosine(37)-N6)-dimethylallyltransferase MiaA [Sphingomonas morindae]USI72080.1 tRNA (adenosine(37)-N6)-dimethylallyltransferase MiaA [Sphingomonas morindae]